MQSSKTITAVAAVVIVLVLGGVGLAYKSHADQVNADNVKMQADTKMKADEAAMKAKATPTPTATPDAMMHETSPTPTPDAMKAGN